MARIHLAILALISPLSALASPVFAQPDQVQGSTQGGAATSLGTRTQPQAVLPLPDTPAGRFAATLLDAYNKAEPGPLLAFNARYARKTPPQDWIDMHKMTGNLTPVKVTSSSPDTLTILFDAAIGDALWQWEVAMDPKNPLRATDLAISTADRPPELAIPRLPRAALDRAMNAKVAQDVADNRFSGTIKVERHGRIIYETAVGLADRTIKTPVEMDTKFRIGSANKMFTAVSVLQLVDQGKVSLDAPIGTYLTDYPNREFAQKVTIRQLLSHTGGAGDIFTPEYEAKRLQVKTLADYVQLFGSRGQDTGKDTKTAYSNYGFILLGRVVEVVSGQDYYDYVRTHIYEPAGMTNSGSPPEDVAVANRSHGYMKGEGGQLVDNASTLPYRGSAAGGGLTTAGDLIRFGNALRSGKLLSSALLTQATTPQRPDGWYGFGFFISGQGPTLNWGHGGGAPGMNAAFRVYPALDAIVVALANLDPLAAENEADFYANRMAVDE